jgi:poly(hydroxyalkanoate) granule-associated protein
VRFAIVGAERFRVRALPGPLTLFRVLELALLPVAGTEEWLRRDVPASEIEGKENAVVKKLKKLAKGSNDSHLASTVRESAQQIWLAGLGAWGKTREEGVKVFDALVKEGRTVEARTRKLAGARVGLVTGQMGKAASDAQAKATATWDRLEHVFEQRVARALHRLGVPTKKEIEKLTARVEELNASVQNVGSNKASARKKKAARRPTAK